MEPLEERRFLTTTTLLNDQTPVETKNTTHTWSASADLAHTHEGFSWKGSSYPGYAAAEPPAGGESRATVKFNGVIVSDRHWTWTHPSPTGSWCPNLDRDYWNPDIGGNSDGARMKFSGSQAEFEISSSGFDLPSAHVYISAVAITALTPEVSVDATDGSASEGEPVDPGTYTFYRYGAPVDVPLTVNYHMSGTATPEDEIDPASAGNGSGGLLNPGPDYYGLTRDGSVSFAVGEISKIVTLTPRNDSINEPAESAISTVVAGANYFARGTPATVMLQSVPITITATNTTIKNTGPATATTNLGKTTVSASDKVSRVTYKAKATGGPAGWKAGDITVKTQAKFGVGKTSVELIYTGRPVGLGPARTYTVSIFDSADASIAPVSITVTVN